MTETTTTRVAITSVIESLLALQRLYKLGELDGINVRASGGSVTLLVQSAEDLAAWADALNCGPFGRHVSRYEDRAPIHSAWTNSLGWHISVTYYEPEPVEAEPGDVLAVEQDAKTIVAETLAEPKPECWCGKTLLANGFCPDYIHGPAKVEVTPDVATAVWDDSVPPGGFVCSVCRTPVESEPCPVHGAECAP